jgi:hypothetical protein
MVRNQVYDCPRGRGYWRERICGWSGIPIYARYVSFNKVVWC